MNELNICILEQSGSSCAAALAKLIVQLYRSAPPELRAEIDRQAHQRKEQTHDK